MKRILLITAILLVLCVFVSCSQDDANGIYAQIFASTPSSSYPARFYMGEDSDGYHYLLTKNKGIIKFKLENNRATESITVDTNGVTNIKYAYLKDDGTIYALTNGNGGIPYEQKRNEAMKQMYDADAKYWYLSTNGFALKDEERKIIDFFPSEKDPVTLEEDVSYVVEQYASEDFIAAGVNGSVFYVNSSVQKEISSLKNKKICDFITVGNNEKYYVAIVNEDSSYFIYIGDSDFNFSSAAIKLSNKPTASFVYTNENGDTVIAYKTATTIDLVNLSKSEKQALTKNYKNGWASNIYTSSTEISRFVKINDSVYAICDNGSMLYIDIKNGKSSSVFDAK